MPKDLAAIEIVDAQFHEPIPPVKTGFERPNQIILTTEMVREAMNCAGVDASLAVAGRDFIDVASERYPNLFRGVVTFSLNEADPEAFVAELVAAPQVLAGRCLVTDFRDVTLKQDYKDGKFDRVIAAAAKQGLPLFFSTHGFAAEMEPMIQRHPELTVIIDHVGVSQHPVSPPQTEPWGKLPGLLGLAKYPNVHVKVCGLPLLSEQNYPFDDVWTNFQKIIDAFGHDRLMWASDYTRLQGANLPFGDQPRRRGVTYADCMTFLLRSDRISYEDKTKLLGGTLRRVLKWDRPTA
jgi:predicted TIM-barrel fold metal-dependent hydrolase